MPLPKEVVETFNDLTSVKVLATVDKDGVCHLSPVGSLSASPDGSSLVFAELFASGKTERLRYMKEKGLTATAIAVISNMQKKTFKGYSVRCKVGEKHTSGPLFDQVSSVIMQFLGIKPRAVYTLIPLEYKVCTPGPEMGKTFKL
ncbi:MAG: pyridoxamine 5'-phosphate oxidase family protein [Candidatus Bathyarchaeota archaeon]